jgi:hypothetical protein
VTSATIVLGFDVSHAVLTLMEYRPEVVVLLVASVDGTIDQRALVASAAVEQVASNAGVKKVERVTVEVKDFHSTVKKIRTLLASTIEHAAPPHVLDLGGGMRLLVLQTFIAYLTLPSRLRRYVDVVVYLEGRNERVRLSYDDLVALLVGEVPEDLTYVERTILEVMEPGRSYTLADLQHLLEQHGLKMSKPNLKRYLDKLVKRGLIERLARGIYSRGA